MALPIASTQHKEIPMASVHKVASWSFASGNPSIGGLVATDLYKIAIRESDGSPFILVDWSTPTWVRLPLSTELLALGETSLTAYRGDHGLAAYTRMLALDQVDNTADADKPISDDTQDALDELVNYIGNGVVSGFDITINADTTKIDISAGVANHVDLTDPEAPVFTKIIYAGETAIVLTNIGTHILTYLAIDSTGTIIQKVSPYTIAERRQYIVLGAAIHSNLTVVNAINSLPDIALNTSGQLVDLIDSLRNFNVTGNVFSGNGANLSLDKSLGTIFKRGVGFSTDPTNPHTKQLDALTAPANMRYRLSDGTEYADTNVIELQWESSTGTKTAMTNHRWYIQRISVFSSNQVRIQHAQYEYTSLAEAYQGLITENFITETNIAENGLLRGYLIVCEDITNFTETQYFRFIEADRFGGIGSGGGSTNTNLQLAYNNSETPEIVTDTTRGALTLKRGSSADTDNVLEIKNNADDITFKVTGNGDIIAHKLNIPLTVVSTASADIDLDSSTMIHVTYTDTGTVNLALKTVALISGDIFNIKDAGLNASVYNIIITPEAELIEGQATYTMNTDGESISIYSDGSNWFIF